MARIQANNRQALFAQIVVDRRHKRPRLEADQIEVQITRIVCASGAHAETSPPSTGIAAPLT